MGMKISTPKKKRALTDVVTPSIRITEDLRRQLDAAARQNLRSLNAEVNHRLIESLKPKQQLEAAE